MKKVLSIILVMLLVFSFVACGNNDTPKGEEARTVVIGSGPSNGIHYVTFTGIASLIEADHANWTVQVEVSTGSNENINNCKTGDVDFGLLTADMAYAGYFSTGAFEGTPQGEILHVMSGYSPHLHVFVRADSDIKTFEDLKGKKAAVGKGFMKDHLNLLLSGYGIDGATYLASQESMALGDMCTALADGNVDVCCYITDFPNGSIADLAMTTGIRFLEVSEEAADKILAESADGKFFYKSEITSDRYSGMDKNIPTLATRTVMVAGKDVPDEVVYEVIKSIDEHQNDLEQFHSRAPLWNLENALKLQTIPLHPGAEKYYKEKGML